MQLVLTLILWLYAGCPDYRGDERPAVEQPAEKPAERPTRPKAPVEQPAEQPVRVFPKERQWAI